MSDSAIRIVGGAHVPRIATLLEPAGRIDATPTRLAENEGIAFQGCIVLGMGFVLEPEQAQAWITEDKRNREVLFPYLNGEDLNSQPDCAPTRWVIDFNDRSEEAASTFTLPFTRVRQLVFPERAKNNRKARRDQWWQFAENASGMRKAIAGLEEVLVLTQTSSTQMPVLVPNGQVFDQKLVVFANSRPGFLALLTSSTHRLWATRWGSTRTGDPVYTPTNVFLTFPRPAETEDLATVGRRLDVERREVMLRRGLGLTKLYNLVNDSGIADADDADVARMRQIHVELDEAVMAAYGWSDVPLRYGFHTYRQMTRWTVCPAARVEILDRLLEENLRRAEAEKRSGADRKPKKAAQGRGRKAVAPKDQEGLF